VPLSWSDFSSSGRPEDLGRSASPATRIIG
jgi:hypothetical protein